MLGNSSLSTKISIMVMAAVTVLTLLLGIAGAIEIRASGAERASERQEANMRVAWDVIERYGDSFHVENGSLYAGYQPLNDFFTPVDRIKNLVGGTATIFMGDKRVSTNVMKTDGTRAVGTVLARGPVFDALFKDGQPYRGEADILGTPFFTAYDPIKNAAGKTIGVLYVGVPRAEFMSATADLETKLAIIAAIAAVVIGLIVMMLSKRMFRPLNTLSNTISQVAEGHVGSSVVGIERGDEIGRMARSIETLRHAVIEQQQLRQVTAKTAEEKEAERARSAEEGQEYEKAHEFFMAQVENGFGELARGDLTIRLDKPFSRDYEGVRVLFNNSVSTLEKAFISVVESIGSNRAGIAEIIVATDDMAQRTEQQAASLEETVAALGEVTSGVKQTADDAGNAQNIATSARQKAQKGGAVVAEAVSAMSEIAASSHQINQIISVIDEIAFQTNLLALNAGVEAARAGDAGKGFAVVAQEVRGLAQRSADAAKEIKGLITKSATQVGQGVELVTASGKSLEEIVTEVSSMADVIATIASSARDQAVSLSEVAGAADQMDKVTQQNAAMIEEATAACQSLGNETEQLAGIMEQFKTSASKRAQQPSHTRNSASPRTAVSIKTRPAMRELRTSGYGGAAPAPRIEAENENWEEF